MKRTLSVLLCVLLLLPCLATGALAAEDDAETVRISTAEELMELAANCVSDTWSQDKTILLENDINLTGLDFTPIPLLSGTFDGQGHNIIGVSFDAAGSTQGLFRMILASGEVKNLRVSGTIKASGTGESIGGIVGQIEPHAEWNFTGGGLSSMRSGLYELESSMNTMLGNMGVGMADAGYLMQDAIDIVSDSIDIINGSAGDDPSGWGGIDDDTSAQLDANFEQLIEIMNALAGIVSDETITYDMQDVSAAVTDVSAAMTEMLYGLGSASDALNITHVADANDPDTAACAVVNGLNRAAVSADTNVGGIAGNIALDVSFDREDQLNISSVILDSGRYEVLALISGCKNYAEVSAVKSCAGGIAGRMDYGLVSLSGSAGSVSAGNEYAGGVAGLSAGTLPCHAAS